MQTAEKNLGLVHLCANRLKGRGIEYEDLYSAGCIGLVKAAKAFDDTRGVQFSTYAVPVILGEMKRLFRDGGTVKVSRSIKELSLKIVRERESFMKKNGREPLISELASILDVDQVHIIEALSAVQPVVSLTSSSDDSDGQIDIKIDAPDIDIGDSIALKQVMSGLSQTDKQLIYLRYYKNLTQSNTAKILGMTQVQVSRKEKKLLTYMRDKMLE